MPCGMYWLGSIWGRGIICVVKLIEAQGQKLHVAYTFQLVRAIYPLKLHINPAKSFVEIWRMNMNKIQAIL